MKKAQRSRTALFAALGMLFCVALVRPRAAAQDSYGVRPITPGNFKQVAPRGFGDRNNSWAQAMVWWRNNLYVGASRQPICTSLYALWQYVGLVISPAFANTWLPYPPSDPDLSCAVDGADISVQAEIWRWSPTGQWDRVFQSPLDLDNPGPGAGMPARPGKKLPYEIAIRDFAVHVEPDGTEALYAFGVNSTIIWDRTKLPPPRILRTTDGVNWTPVPQEPGTFLRELPFNPDHSSFRAAVSYGGKLFALCGPAFGQGSLVASANPSQGNNAWFLAAPPNLLFYELAVFDGWLYLGGFDTVGGYAVYKTRAEGPPPYQLTTVVPGGAFLQDHPSKSVVSMHVFDGRLYVGTATFTEIIRINPDDTWDLVIGTPRTVPSPSGPTIKYPVSGLDAGFGQTLNDHAWQMSDPFRTLYIGTYNATTSARFDPNYGSVLRANMGAHLFRTQEGWYYSPITLNAFSSPADPKGGIFDFGIRTMASTPHGIFLGTANDYYGLAVFHANTRGDAAPDPPARLEIEPGRSGAPLLSWNRVPPAKIYHIWRAEIVPVLVRDDVNFEGWNGISGNKVRDTVFGPFVKIGSTVDLFFRDATIVPGKKYVYYVTAEGQPGLPSAPSNLAAFPLNTPPVTFAQLLSELDRWNQRSRFVLPSRYLDLRAAVTAAQGLASSCRMGEAIVRLTEAQAPLALLSPESTDANVLIGKLQRRLGLLSPYPQEVSCSDLAQ